MSSGVQVDLDWAGSGAGESGAGAPGGRSVPAGKYLTDEEILGLDQNDSGAFSSDSAIFWEGPRKPAERFLVAP